METDTPQNETGGLKLVTVFIAVLALHVLVIGGISIYNLLKTPAIDAASIDYTQAQRPDPAAYGNETVPSAQESAPLYQDAVPTFETRPSTSEPTIQTAQTAPEPAPSFDARLSVPEPPAPAPTPEYTAASQPPAVWSSDSVAQAVASSSQENIAATVPATPQAPIPYTPSLSDGVPPAYGGMQDPFAVPTAPEQTLATTVGGPAQAPTHTTVSVAGDAITHEIKPGETLGKIRSLYGVTLAELMAWNNIKDANRIRAGQKLVIQRTQTATVPAPDTSGTHATAAPKKAPSKAAVAKAKKEVVPSSVAVHRVSQGETLYSIARKYDTTVNKILAVNSQQLSDPSRLRVGMRLSLPAHHQVTKKTKKSAAGTASSSIPISTDIVMR